LTLPADAEATARLLADRHGVSRGEQVVEIGDGAYAASFRPLGIRTRVIESLPAPRPEIQSAKIVMARDAICRAELNPFLRGVCSLLSPDGIAVFELPHVLPMVERLDYDMIGHERACYFSIEVLRSLTARNGLELIDAMPIADTAGNIRVIAQRAGGPLFARPSVDAFVEQERAASLNLADAWADFTHLVEHSRDLLTSEIEDWLYRGKRIVGYTRDGRGMTLLSFCGFDSRQIPVIIDENARLHGRLTPGHRIPIMRLDQLHEQPADLILWLAGDWCDDSGDRLAKHCRRGTRVLVPLPKPHFAELSSNSHQCMADLLLADTIAQGSSFSEFF
jgi:hypothetical protein